MASVNFLYRSTKDKAPLILRLLFRHENKDYVFGAKTKFEVTEHYWSKQHKLQRIKDIGVLNKQSEVNKELHKISNYILTSFNSIPDIKVLDVVNKEWLQKQIDTYYNPPKTKEEEEQAKIPIDLISYIDFYLEYRKHEITEALRKKNNVVKNKLIRFQKQRKKTILIKDVNDKFKNEFVNYCIEQGYSQNTMQRELVIIKTFCKHARYLGLEVHPQMDGLRLDRQKVQSIYLTFDELEQIEKPPIYPIIWKTLKTG